MLIIPLLFCYIDGHMIVWHCTAALNRIGVQSLVITLMQKVLAV